MCRLAHNLFNLPFISCLNVNALSFENTEAFGHLESARWAQHAAHAVTLEGWCITQDITAGPWSQIEVYIGEHLVATAPPLYRPDVANAYPHLPRAAMSGFTACLSWAELDSVLLIRVRNGQGSLITLLKAPAGELPGRGVIISNYPVWSLSDQLNRTRPPPKVFARSFSLIVPVYRPPLNILRECLESICAQWHPHWSACLVDDSGGDSEVQMLLREFADRDDRFEILTNSSNQGIAHSTNHGIERAQHDWLVFLDHDDTLLPYSLAVLAETIEGQPEVELIYTDEEKISAEGQPRTPFFKPDWSPVFAQGVMYPGHLLCVRTNLVVSSGGVDSAFNGIQDFELLLRLSEHTRQIVHLPQTLYQWRMIPGSSATTGDVKGDMERLQCKAIQSQLIRQSRRAIARGLGGHRVILEPPEDYTLPAFTAIEASRKQIEQPSLLPLAPDNEWVLLKSNAIESIDDVSLLRLLFHAGDNPNTLTAPVLLSQDGKVLESGCTVASSGRFIRIMFGYDSHADGNHGSLRCHREVGTTSAGLLVTSSALWNELILIARDPNHSGQSLPELMLSQKKNVVVIANSRAIHRLPLRSLHRELPFPIHSTALQDGYWNPRYDASFADYRLIRDITSELRYRIESHFPSRTHDGRIRISGWCLGPPHRHITGIRIKMNSWIVESRCQQARPDVLQAFPDGVNQTPGFELRVEFPPGEYEVDLQVRIEGRPNWHSLQTRQLKVEPAPPLDCVFRANFENRDLAFTLGLHARHPPKTITYPTFPQTRSQAQWPSVSVVTPSFQQGEFLPQTLNSISSLLPDGLAHVVQDGGSTDQTLDYLKSHPLPHRKWISAPDDGQAQAIMLGFAQTSGEPDDVMAWLNADDFYVPGAVDFVRGYFAEHPDVDLIYGNRIVVDSTGLEINRWFLPPHDDDVLSLNDFVPQETMFWRRRIWDRVGGLDCRFQFALDWDFLLRCQAAGARITHIPEFLGCFRVHPDQKSSAHIDGVGQTEINELRSRSFDPPLQYEQIAASPILGEYLAASRQLRAEAITPSPG